MVMFRLLGTGWAMGTFILAWMFPNLLRRLAGEGALSASFIPAYTKTLERGGPAPAKALLGSVSGALVVGLACLTAVVVALTMLLPPEWFGRVAADGTSASDSGRLLLLLTAILFPYCILICLAAVYAGALNSLSVFAAPAALPVVLNAIWIAILAGGYSLYPDDAQALTVITAIGLVLAGFVQLGLVASILRRRGALPWPRFPGPGDPARAVFTSIVPTVIGLSILQVNVVVDQAFAYYAIAPGANSHVYMANRLLLFPHALTSIAVATAVFPQLALLFERGQLANMRTLLDRAASSIVFMAVPAALGVVLVAEDFLNVFFVGGEFTADDASVSAHTTAFLVAGLPFIGVGGVLVRALFAIGDMRAPAQVAAVLVPANLVLDTLFVVGLGMGPAGLTLASALCMVINVAMLRVRLRRHIPGGVLAWTSWLRLALATAAMAAVVVGCQHAFASAATPVAVGLLRLLLPITVGMAVYGGVQWWLGSPDLQKLVRRR